MSTINFILRSKDTQDEILQSSHFLCQHSNLLFTLYSMYEEDEKEDNIIVDIIYDYEQYKPLFTCLNSGMIDLNFILSYPINIFIDIYNFLTFLQYDNTINFFTNQRIQQNNNVTSLYIDYIMKYSVELSNIQTGLFLKQEIHCVLNYVNTSPLDIQMVHMTTYFFNTYLKQEYDISVLCDMIIKHNKRDIFEHLNYDEQEKCYEYIHLYDNRLTYRIKCNSHYINYVNNLTKECKEYMEKIEHDAIFNKCKLEYDINLIKSYINRGIDINHYMFTYSLLGILIRANNIDAVKSILEDINILRIDTTHLYKAINETIRINNYELLNYLITYIEKIESFDLNDANYGIYNDIPYYIESNMQLNLTFSYYIIYYADINIIELLISKGLIIELYTDIFSLLYFMVTYCFDKYNDSIKCINKYEYIFTKYLLIKLNKFDLINYINIQSLDAINSLSNLIYDLSIKTHYCNNESFYMTIYVNILSNLLYYGAELKFNNIDINNEYKQDEYKQEEYKQEEYEYINNYIINKIDNKYIKNIIAIIYANNKSIRYKIKLNEHAINHFIKLIKPILLYYTHDDNNFKKYLTLNGMKFDNDIINDDIDLFDTILKDI